MHLLLANALGQFILARGIGQAYIQRDADLEPLKQFLVSEAEDG